MPTKVSDAFRSIAALRELYDIADAALLPVHGADLCLALPLLARDRPVALRAWQYFCTRGYRFTAPEPPTVARFTLRFHEWVEWSAPADITQAWR